MVCPYNKKKFGPNMLLPQNRQSVHRVTGAWAIQFDVTHPNLCQVRKQELAHGHAVVPGAQYTGFVPSVAGWNNIQDIQLKLRQRGLRQSQVRVVRRIKSTTEQTDPFEMRCGAQTQSLACKK